MSVKLKFEQKFQEIKQQLLNELLVWGFPQDGQEWLEKCLTYNVPHGKLNRGLAVVETLKCLQPEGGGGGEEAAILGWCVEFLQAFCLVADDIMDQSLLRRGKTCWYKNDQVGLIAINDAFLMESMVYRILARYFDQHPCYPRLVKLFQEIVYKTELGQMLDLITCPPPPTTTSSPVHATTSSVHTTIDAETTLKTADRVKTRDKFHLFTMDRYLSIVRLKTAYYSFYLPVALALTLHGETRESVFREAEGVLIPLGVHFQIQDDYLDCYGDPAITGKIGTDIEDNKCSWLIVKALELATSDQRNLLKEHYGRSEQSSVDMVKSTYNQLDLVRLYQETEELSYQRLLSLTASTSLDPVIYQNFIQKIYKRNK